VSHLKRLRQFMSEVWSELKKTTWPGRTEVYGTTLVVIVTVLICAFYLWVVDLVLNRAMEKIFGWFG
jgi:preprotein translocase subunit SecE